MSKKNNDYFDDFDDDFIGHMNKKNIAKKRYELKSKPYNKNKKKKSKRKNSNMDDYDGDIYG